MANNCYYIAKAIGSKEAVEEFARVLAGEGEFANDRLGRVSDFETEGAVKTRARDIWTLEGHGNCDWSVETGMMAEGLGRGEARSLESEAARLHIAVEIYSSETDIGFQEHVLVVDGRVLKSDCVDYEEYFVEDLEHDGVLEETAAMLGVSPDYLRENVNHNGEYVIGGFGEDFGSFRGIAKMEHEYAFLRDMDVLREGKVQICRQDDGSVSFFFGNTGINGMVDFLSFREGRGFALADVSGDQVARGEWNDLSEPELWLYAMELGKHLSVEEVEREAAPHRGNSLEKAIEEASAAAESRYDKAEPRQAPEQEH